MANPECKTCRWYEDHHCHRNAPLGSNDADKPVWIGVASWDWCGEHSLPPEQVRSDYWEGGATIKTGDVIFHPDGRTTRVE